jgi:glyoxylate reductase
MKPTAYLINTSRGPVVDEAALVGALRERRIAGAGLDVYEREPEISAPLLEMSNVVLLPHIGSATLETRTAMAMLAVENAIDVLSGRAPRSEVRL